MLPLIALNTAPVVPSLQNIGAVKFNNSQTFFTASIASPFVTQNIACTKFNNQQVFTTGVVAIPPAPPFDLTIGTVTSVPNGTPSSATITGSLPVKQLNLVLQSGPQGNPGSGGGANLGVNALDFAGADLGAKINTALVNNLDVFVPNSANLVISTPIRLKHACTLQFSNRYPQHIVCKTNDKPVFEAIGDIRHWRVIRGIFDGSNIDTPSSLLLCGRDNAGNQCGDTVGFSNVHATGFWGQACVVNIAAEVIVFEDCNLWNNGKGDSVWGGPNAAVMVANKDYWGSFFAYTQPNQNAGSCSAITFRDCDIRGGASPSTVGLIKGQVEDLTIIPTYSNSGGGRAHWLFEPGIGMPRRISIRGGGRSECNSAVPNPFILMDGMNVGGAGIYHLDVGPMSFFESSPAIIQTINGGRIDSLNWHPTNYIWPENTPLLDHQTASLEWTTIKCRTPSNINLGGQSANHADIKIAGNFNGVIGTGSKIRSANQSNW